MSPRSKPAPRCKTHLGARGHFRAAALPLALAVVSAPAVGAPADAETCKLSPRECGRQAFDAGVAAFKREDYPAALAAFQRAFSIQQHAVVVFNLALAEAKVNMPIEAAQHFEQVIADPAAEAEFVQRAKAELELARQMVASISVELVSSGSEAHALVLEVDGQAISGASPSVQLNPGTYTIRVLLDGKQVLTRKVELSTSERLRLAVDRSGTVRDSAPPVAKPIREEPQGLSPTWAIAGAGLTLVLAGVTVWSGLDTQSAVQDFDEREARLSEAEAQELLDAGHAKETRTNILLAATGVVALGSAILAAFFVDWGGVGQPREATSAPSWFLGGPSLRDLSLGYQGRF